MKLDIIPTASGTTREEMEAVMRYLNGAYPAANKRNIEAGLDTWMFELGKYPFEDILKAVRFHVNTSKYFPSPSEIISKMTRAKLVYQNEKPESEKSLPDHQEPEDDDDDILEKFINID